MSNELELDKMEELIQVITEFRNALQYINEFNMKVDRESNEVEVNLKFRL